MNEFYPILLVILFFCGSIIVHEFGHYIAARVRGLYVPRFSIGFGPRLFSKKIGETEFCLSLLPLGGYVAIPQLVEIDKIEGKYDIPDNIKQASCTDKVIVAVMGAVANIIFALVLGAILWCTGIPVDSSTLSRTIGYIEQELELSNGRKVISPAREAGLQVGDEIISVDGSEIKNFSDIQQFLALGVCKDSNGRAYSDVDFIRSNQKMKTTVYPILCGEVDKFRQIGIFPKQELVVDSTLNNAINVYPDDKLLSIDGIPVLNIRFLQEYVAGKDNVRVEFLRDGKNFYEGIDTIKIAAIKPYIQLSIDNTEINILPFYAKNVNKGKVSEHTDSSLFLFSGSKSFLKKYNLENGVNVVAVNKKHCSNLQDILKNFNKDSDNVFTILRSDMPVDVFLPKVDSITLVPAVYKDVLGINFRNNIIIVNKSPLALIRESFSATFKTLCGLFNSHSDVSMKNLMGPAGLVRALHACSKTDIRLLLWFVILINVNLAVLNLLPLPVLDGGCIVLALLEKVTSDKCRCIDNIFGVLQSVFLFLLLALLVYVSIFDIKRWQVDSNMRSDYEHQSKLRLL